MSNCGAALRMMAVARLLPFVRTRAASVKQRIAYGSETDIKCDGLARALAMQENTLHSRDHLVHFLKTSCASALAWDRRAPARLQKPRWSVAFPGECTSTSVEMH